jgi:hypothetical protein
MFIMESRQCGTSGGKVDVLAVVNLLQYPKILASQTPESYTLRDSTVCR